MRIVKSGSARKIIVTASEVKKLMSKDDVNEFIIVTKALSSTPLNKLAAFETLKGLFGKGKGTQEEAQANAMLKDVNALSKQLSNLMNNAAKYYHASQKGSQNQVFFGQLYQVMAQMHTALDQTSTKLGIQDTTPEATPSGATKRPNLPVGKTPAAAPAAVNALKPQQQLDLNKWVASYKKAKDANMQANLRALIQKKYYNSNDYPLYVAIMRAIGVTPLSNKITPTVKPQQQTPLPTTAPTEKLPAAAARNLMLNKRFARTMRHKKVG
jgi:hypothetical protein